MCVVGCHSGLSGKAWPGWERISRGKDIMLPDRASDLMLIRLTVRPQSISSTAAPITDLWTCSAHALFAWCSNFWNILMLYKNRAICNVVLWEFLVLFSGVINAIYTVSWGLCAMKHMSALFIVFPIHLWIVTIGEFLVRHLSYSNGNYALDTWHSRVIMSDLFSSAQFLMSKKAPISVLCLSQVSIVTRHTLWSIGIIIMNLFLCLIFFSVLCGQMVALWYIIGYNIYSLLVHLAWNPMESLICVAINI